MDSSNPWLPNVFVRPINNTVLVFSLMPPVGNADFSDLAAVRTVEETRWAMKLPNLLLVSVVC